MAAAQTGTLISREAFESLPDAPGKQELLEGELTVLPPPKRSHNRIAKAFYNLLTAALDQSRVEIEAGFQMTPATWLQPDLSVTWPDQPVVNDYFQGSPMIAVEIVSRGNTAEEISRKTTSYLRHGAAEVWIVYPQTHSLVIHQVESVTRTTETYRSNSIPVILNLPDLLGA